MAKKRDINLLESLNQSTKKKSSSSMTAIMAFGIVVLIGAMVFLFASAKVQVSKNNEVLDDLNEQLSKEEDVIKLEEAYAKAQQEYMSKISDVIASVYPNKSAIETAKMSSMFMSLLFDYIENTDDAMGENTIKVTNMKFTSSTVTLLCGTNTYSDGWHFIRFLAGELDTEESKKNLLYFSGVEENYPGFPSSTGEGEYGISFTLKFNVNWGAFA